MDYTASIGVRFTAAELPSVGNWITSELAEAETPERLLAAGLIDYLQADFGPAARRIKEAYLGFKDDGRRRRAAVAAAQLSRLYHDGIGNEAVGHGWQTRAQRLLVGEGDCVERGWSVLCGVACSVADAEELERNSAMALAMAQLFDDVDLECKALADSGLALVGLGRVGEGMSRIDEAMTMSSSGECDNVFVTGQVQCTLISACQRTGDLRRLESWMSIAVAAEPAWLGADAPPNLLLGHCSTEYGSLLCQTGRWSEAEVALRRAVDILDAMHYQQRASSRCALAQLRVNQGRLVEAAGLLNGLEQAPEAQLALTLLHQARGDHELAAAVARQGLRTFNGDRLRTAPLYCALVNAELARGNLAGAREASDALERAAATAPHPPVQAMAAWARGRVAFVSCETSAAAQEFEAGLCVLPGEEWPLLAAELRLELARALSPVDRALAIAEARQALAVFGKVGAHRLHAAQALLAELGDVAAAAVPVARLGELTPREREILQLLAQGLSNPQIAAKLVISPKTAEHHVGAILRKLQLASRSEAAVYAATLATPPTARTATASQRSESAV
jgi:DNA-binding CsgD family transcriptional regulator